ncbi:hypothetical protein GQ457_02G023870 [Hibiscus cannabinus]
MAAPSRAPIEKLLQHRAYPFVGIIREKPEEAEYWLGCATQIVIEQLSCSDEHKLECVVTLLVDEALSWWETTTLTTSTEKVTWEFFVKEFKKKYICEQHFEERREKFLYPNQGRKPISHPITYTLVSRSNFTPRPPNDIKLAILKVSYNLCYACGRDDHFIRDCPRNIQKVSTQPPIESSFTPLVRNKGPNKVQSGNQRRGKGNYSKASTHQESRILVRVYHVEGRDDEKSLEIITEESV